MNGRLHLQDGVYSLHPVSAKQIDSSYDVCMKRCIRDVLVEMTNTVQLSARKVVMTHTRLVGLVVVAALGVGAGVAAARPAASDSASSRKAVTHVVAGGVRLAPGQTGIANTPDCPAGELVTGGGSFVSSNTGNPDSTFVLSRSSPRFPHDSRPQQWSVAGRNTGNFPVDVTVFGLCSEGTLGAAATDASASLPPVPPGLMPGKSPTTH
ncbi:hypothetical protein ACFVJM_38940 [Streptomyces virginiae]|uniref:hypothetical protein n=1 Tax=Streptomyces virginiae TaxID=1961 RepID=UPI003630B279